MLKPTSLKNIACLNDVSDLVPFRFQSFTIHTTTPPSLVIQYNATAIYGKSKYVLFSYLRILSYGGEVIVRSMVSLGIRSIVYKQFSLCI
jgi:hypothetical protein